VCCCVGALQNLLAEYQSVLEAVCLQLRGRGITPGQRMELEGQRVAYEVCIAQLKMVLRQLNMHVTGEES